MSSELARGQEKDEEFSVGTKRAKWVVRKEEERESTGPTMT
jgi:hypothetical protein